MLSTLQKNHKILRMSFTRQIQGRFRFVFPILFLLESKDRIKIVPQITDIWAFIRFTTLISSQSKQPTLDEVEKSHRIYRK